MKKYWSYIVLVIMSLLGTFHGFIREDIASMGLCFASGIMLFILIATFERLISNEH